ncbi:transposase [Endozoicomonas sp. OPT23]|uniref:transposase n=1 Tax=Endozoicomonas sp. OPT23 TaxID=2072845 RepID=UPI00129BB686|nr:transposase [Endozoicomonas sp. OPT23]MRI33517.1 transposase [Endozoicomonas sp. OPT23]
MTTARKHQIDPKSTPYYHCIARCVRRAFLCGKDKYSGINYEHRRQWVVERIKELSGIFAIETCAYAVMSNHYHVVLHINLEQCRSWDRREVLSRWCKLFSGHPLVQRFLANDKMSKAELDRVDEFAEEYRCRLMDISWYMRCLNEYLAREANREDGCKGRFWEGRYKSQALLDEAALLTCMAYVDLNPIRARLAETPETSEYTSIKERIEKNAQPALGKDKLTALKAFQAQGGNPDTTIPFQLNDYLELVDWTGRAVRQDKRGYIPEDVPSVLQRLNIDSEEWLKTMRWNNRFRQAVGKLAALKAYAEQQGKQWVQGVGSSQRLYQ